MKKNIVFLLVNGIGFGHFKLAMTIAQHFDANKYQIYFLTQAKSTRIFEGHDYRVINIPQTYKLNSNNEVLLIHKIVNNLIYKIDPVLVIEDTYPEDFYLNLPSLIFVPKMLIINRLMATEFENYYYSGVLGQYSKLLILKEKNEFAKGLTASEAINFVNYSDKLLFCGDVFNQPSEVLCARIRNKYQLDKFEKNVVINCGAGGWHIGENICKKIFETIVDIANNIAKENIKIQFILLIGPYSSYISEFLQPRIEKDTMIDIVDFEDHADALFHEADLVILRPGYNSTMEALAGRAQVLLLPGISYLEDQLGWCTKLKAEYNIDYVPVSNLDLLERHIRKLLFTEKGRQRVVVNHAGAAMESIAGFVDAESHCPQMAFLCIKKSKGICKLIESLIDKLLQLGVCICDDDYVYGKDMKVRIINQNCNYDEFNTLPIVAIYNDEKMKNNDFSFYQKRYHLSENGIISLPITEFILRGESVSSVRKLQYILQMPHMFIGSVCIKIDTELSNKKEIVDFLEWFCVQIQNKQIVPISLKQWLNDEVNNRHYGIRYGHYSPEITKLQ